MEKIGTLSSPEIMESMRGERMKVESSCWLMDKVKEHGLPIPRPPRRAGREIISLMVGRRW